MKHGQILKREYGAPRQKTRRPSHIPPAFRKTARSLCDSPRRIDQNMRYSLSSAFSKKQNASANVPRHLRPPTFTQDKASRNIPRKGWRPKGQSVGQRQKSIGAAAGTVERLEAAAAIQIQHKGVHRGHTCPLYALLGTFPAREKYPRVRGWKPREVANRIAIPGEEKYFSPARRNALQPYIGQMPRHGRIKKVKASSAPFPRFRGTAAPGAHRPWQ